MALLVFAEKSISTGATVFTPLLKWEYFQVPNTKILYQPGVYGDIDNTSNRVNICLESENSETRIAIYEKCLQGNNVCSCIKEDHIKAKMSWDKVLFFDSSGNKIERPAKLGGCTANIQYCIKGKWLAMNRQGLVLEVSHIQILNYPDEKKTCPFVNGMDM